MNTLLVGVYGEDSMNVISVNMLQVVNASSNILIYLCVGQAFRAKVKKILRIEDCQYRGNCFVTSFIQFFKVCR